MLFLHHLDMDHVSGRRHSSEGYGDYHTSSPTSHVNTSATSLYDVLQIPSTATSAEVKAAFRRLARLYHPDAVARHSSLSGPATTTHTATAEEIDRITQHFLKIHAAYTTVSDPQIRLASISSCGCKTWGPPLQQLLVVNEAAAIRM